MLPSGKIAAVMLVCLGLALTPLTAAQSAPQILGLAATAEPVPLRCGGAGCAAELSAFCLQEEKPIPPAGTAYRQAPGTRITLIHQAPGRGERRLALPPGLALQSARQFTAVRVSLPRRLVEQLGPGRLSISVAPGAALVPVPLPGDARPLSAREIADVAAAARALAGTGFADQTSAAAGAAVHLNQLVNALPEARPPTKNERARLLERAKTSAHRLPAATRRRVLDAVGDCAGDFNQYMIIGLRSCLAHHHDGVMVDLTRRAWKKLAPGS